MQSQEEQALFYQGKVINKKSLRSMIKNKAVCSRIKISWQCEQSDRNQIYSRLLHYQAFSQTKNQNFVRFIQNHEQFATCPICMSELIEPVATGCGHLFCLQCIEKALISGNRCPLCRQTIADEDNYGIVFDRKAQILINKLNNFSQTKQYKSHKQSYYQWKNKRLLTQQEINSCPDMFIDVWMSEGGWFTGKIKEVYRLENSRIEAVMVQMIKNSKPVREIIEFGSLRLSKPYFYNTKNEKFQLFRLGLRDMRQNGLNYENFLTSQFFAIRSRLFIETLPIQNGESNLRPNENTDSVPIISRVESQLLSVENDSPMFQNLQPLPMVQNPQIETISLQNLNPSRSRGADLIGNEMPDSEQDLPSF